MEERLEDVEGFCRQFWEGMWGAIGRLGPSKEGEDGEFTLADFCYDPRKFVLVLPGSKTFVGLEEARKALIQAKDFEPTFGQNVTFQTVSVFQGGDLLTALVM